MDIKTTVLVCIILHVTNDPIWKLVYGFLFIYGINIYPFFSGPTEIRLHIAGTSNLTIYLKEGLYYVTIFFNTTTFFDVT